MNVSWTADHNNKPSGVSSEKFREFSQYIMYYYFVKCCDCIIDKGFRFCIQYRFRVREQEKHLQYYKYIFCNFYYKDVFFVDSIQHISQLMDFHTCLPLNNWQLYQAASWIPLPDTTGILCSVVYYFLPAILTGLGIMTCCRQDGRFCWSAR